MKRFLLTLICLIAIGCGSTMKKIAQRAVYPFDSVNKDFPMDGFAVALLAPWKELRLGAAGGTHAIYAQVNSAAPWVIYFHGNGENLEALRRYGMLDALPALEVNVMVIDYPGLGTSVGAVDQEGITAAGLLAYDWVAARAISDISIIGRSLGAAVAAQVASERPVRHLILISPWTDLKTLALRTTDLAKKVPESFWAANSWDTLGSSPQSFFLLVIHGVEDTIIPYDMGKAVSEGHEDAGLFAVENLSHNDIFSDGQVFALLFQALQL